MENQTAESTHPAGTWRRFGQIGPVYQILAPAGKNAHGAALMRIRVLESGEELDYKLDAIVQDPLEA